MGNSNTARGAAAAWHGDKTHSSRTRELSGAVACCLLANTNSSPPSDRLRRARAPLSQTIETGRKSTGDEQTKIRTPPGIIGAPALRATARGLARRTMPDLQPPRSAQLGERNDDAPELTDGRTSTSDADCNLGAPIRFALPAASPFDSDRCGISRTSASPAWSLTPPQTPQHSARCRASARFVSATRHAQSAFFVFHPSVVYASTVTMSATLVTGRILT